MTDSFGLVSAADAVIVTVSDFLITSLDDHDDGGCTLLDCTLREAITATNNISGVQTVTFAPGLAGTLVISSALGSLPAIAGDLFLVGPGRNVIAISGDDAVRVLEISSGVVSISGLTLTGGNNFIPDLPDFPDDSLDTRGGSGLYVEVGAHLTGDDLAISANTSTGDGGGIRNRGALTLTNSLVDQNTAAKAKEGLANGGGIANEGTIFLGHTQIVSNTVPPELHRNGAHGGGVYNGDGAVAELDNVAVYSNTAIFGGGISNAPGGTSVLTLTNSAVFSNTASRDPITANDPGDGGGIFHGGSQLAIVNSTISGNQATDNGGGLRLFFAGTTSLNNVTIANNTADSDKDSAIDAGGDGGGIFGSGGTLTTIQNSLIADNLDLSGESPDCSAGIGVITSGGYNLIGTDEGCNWVGATGDITGTVGSLVDPLLGTPVFSGSTPLLLPLLTGSPAIDAGNPITPSSSGLACESTDQQGTSRPQDGDGIGSAVCDIGAFELEEAGVGSAGGRIGLAKLIPPNSPSAPLAQAATETPTPTPTPTDDPSASFDPPAEPTPTETPTPTPTLAPPLDEISLVHSAPVLDSAILTPTNGTLFDTLGPIAVEGGAFATDYLRALSVTVNGGVVFTLTWPADSTSNTNWATTFTPPGDGVYLLDSVAVDGAGTVQTTTHPITITVDSFVPSVLIASDVLTSAHEVAPGIVTMTGTGSAAWATVEVDAGDGFAPAVFDGAAWSIDWIVPGNLDGGSHPVTARITDQRNRTGTDAKTVIVDVIPPAAVTVTLAYRGSGGITAIEPFSTVRESGVGLIVNWTASADGSGLADYRVGWSREADPALAALTALNPAGARSHEQTAGEAEVWFAHLISTDIHGNRTTQTVGPVFVDAPTTPDLVNVPGYLGWMESGASLVGVDNEIQSADDSRAAQSLHASWNADSLRLVWAGADWSGDGDLFVYLNTDGGGASELYDPYPVAGAAFTFGVNTPPAANPIFLPAGFAARYLVWVQDSQTATLLRFDGADWTAVQPLDPTQFAMDSADGQPLTDLTLPFSLLGLSAGSSLQALALAAEENVLSLWAAIPDKTALNSERVINPTALGRDLSGYRLTQRLAFPSLGDGVLPNGGKTPGASLTLAIAASPGVAVGYLADDLLDLLTPGTPLDANLDGVPDVPLPVNQSPQPVGNGPVSYEIHYSNDGTATARNVTLRSAAFGALQLSSPATVNIGDVAAGISGTVTFAGNISGGVRSAELNVTVADALHGDFDWLWMQAPVDGVGPLVSILAPQGYAPTSPTLILGNGTDDSGVPTIQIEITNVPGDSGRSVRRILDCADPTPGDGAWVCAWNPGDLSGVGQVTLRARGIDSFGNVGDFSPALTLEVDISPPTVLLDATVTDFLADGFINGLELFWAGQVVDDKQVARLSICQGDALGDGCAENTLFGEAVAPWQRDFADEWRDTDGVAHDLALTGKDAAGNRTTIPLTRTFVVDTVSPVITVTAPISESFVVAIGGADTPIAGSVSDGSGIARMTALLSTPAGQFLVADVPVAGNTWRYLPQLAAEGEYLLILVAWDRAGNATTTDAFRVLSTCREETGLKTSLTVTPADELLQVALLSATITRTTGADLPAGIPLSFFQDGALMGVVTTTQPLLAGQSQVVTMTVPITSSGDYAFTVKLDDDGSGAGVLRLCRATTFGAGVSIQDLPLDESWHLLSSSVTHFDTDTQVVERTIAGSYFTIQSFDGEALAYYPHLAAQLNTLQTLDARHGYWIKTLSGATPTLRIWGERLAAQTPLPLQTGWNLVSYLPQASKPVTEALASIAGKFTAVLAFDNAALSFYPDLDSGTNTLHTLSPGFGYWIRATEPVTLTYPSAVAAAGADPAFTELAQTTAQAALEASVQVTATNLWMNFYGPAAAADGAILPAGTVVLAVDADGVVCGAVQMIQAGRYGLLACYGDDPQTAADEGALPGDLIQLVVDGVVLAQGVWTGNGERERLTLGEWQNPVIYLPVVQQGGGTQAVEEIPPQEADDGGNVNPEDDPADGAADFHLWLPAVGGEGAETP
ncbi:MAG: hypothetical protein DWI57_06650 [Chloroflexi bacterium]|nr:MAG: hypothetical protein DWI57_06650 [Chloroflexota bacterium]